MATNPASLDNLRDIVLPPPIPWLPPAIGWTLVGAALIAAAAVALWRAIERWRANAYRREALRQLAFAEAAAKTGDEPPMKGAADILAILKRAALAAYPRVAVADLTGAQWAAFLDKTGATRDFTSGPGKVLWPLTYGALSGSGHPDAAFAAARRWLRRHRGAESG
jgi:hypothetical protein